MRINDEANLNVLDRAFAAEQTRLFERDLRRAVRVREENAGRPAEAPVQAVQAPLEGHL